MFPVRRSRWPQAVVALAATVAALALPSSLRAQQGGTVRGTVTDSATGRPVVGVQVTVTGAAARAQTNDAGTYQLVNVAPGRITLRLQRLGYSVAERATTVTAGGTVTENFTLRPAATVLSTIVATGYGSSQRATVSSAIASVDSTALARIPVASIDNALQGRIAGVQVMQNSGEPGAGVSVRVRGPASLNAGNQPLYVIDGVPILQGTFEQITGTSGQRMTPISGINPDDIASIDVLKDAAAAAIYGSRGSNGVVLITTKRGAAGNKFRFNISSYGGTQEAERKLDLLNATDYVNLLNEGRANQGQTPLFAAGTDSINTDWQDAVLRTAPMSDVQVSVSGGTDRLRMFLSGSNFRQQGIVIASDYQRQATRFNLDAQATKRLTLQTNMGLTRESNDRVPGDQNLDGIVTNATALQPFSPVTGTSFGFAGIPQGLLYSNPAAYAAFSTLNVRTLRALGNIDAKYSVTDALSLTARAGADVYTVDETRWRSPKVDRASSASVGGEGASGRTNASRLLTELFANFDAYKSDAQTLALTAGTSAERNQSDFNYVAGTGFPTGFERYVRNAAQVSSFDGGQTENTLVSYFARANWSFRERYLLSASVRSDGSSRFGTNNRFGTFSAISGAWTLTDEGFAEWLARRATVKLRGSYGTTGNQGISDFASRTLATSQPYAGTTGLAGSQLGNPNLKWEETTEADFGADIGLFNGRVTLIADWYDRATDNLLVQRPVPATSGYTTVWDNVGAISNRGWDFNLQTINIQSDKRDGFEWKTDFNVTFNKNKVTALYDGLPITATVSGRVTSVAAVGQPLGTFFVFKFLGVDPATGNAQYQAANGSITTAPVSADLTFGGNPQPKYFGGLTNSISYKGFDFRGFLQFSQGSRVLNMIRIFADDGGNSRDNKLAIVKNRWQKPGDITDQPRMGSTGGARFLSTRMIEDGSFMRLQELTLGYRLPSKLARSLRADNARLYITGRNLATWDKYLGYNADVNSSGANANTVMGVDYYAYPLARTFTFGINAGW
ncbi:SusC/RagA family TonB-linked outer membrane protein [Gemmatimonas sp.]|jgi:TonB-linked SusC/RagA family outer membrane protein|uniref:SusC/RagA family TonB-linked outer membrane protein n=1 Tax=Gemmatimonas sp. TaxID=1962908 RepID=UPI0031C80078|nr:SusC/RagA family TonB-linked outer membrane protein [Gemmatimonas sp.]